MAMLNQFEIPYNDLKIEKQLGSGNFGAVFLAYYNDIPVAVKKLTPKDDDSTSFSDALRKQSQTFVDFIGEAKVRMNNLNNYRLIYLILIGFIPNPTFSICCFIIGIM